MAFPLPQFPSTGRVWTHGGRLNSMFLAGDPVVFTISSSAATGYFVLDYWGTQVSSGTVTGTTMTPAVPSSGGWKPGYYRLFLTGPVPDDATYGPSYGACGFAVLPPGRHCPDPPAWDALAATRRDDNTDLLGANDGTNRVAMSVCGVGPARYGIFNTLNPTADLTSTASGVTLDNAWYLTSFAADSARPRPLLQSWAQQGVDRTTNGNISIFPKDETVDGSTTFVEWQSGSTGGVKLRIHSPASGTVVETFDNLTTTAAISAVPSSYVKLFATGGVLPTTGGAASAVGRGYRDAVTATVAAAPAEITRFEGPVNEAFGTQGWTAAETAHAMRLFNKSVKAGRPSATVVGPCPVNINTSTTAAGGWFDQFLAAGGGAWCDEISVHPYNQILGDLGRGRAQMDNFVSCLTRYGQQGKPVWSSEHSSQPDVYDSAGTGVMHVRRARMWMLDYLLLEQYGIPKERCTVFHDSSQGDWQHPWFLFESQATYYGFASVGPAAPMLRTYAEEIWGKVYASKYDFGDPGNTMYLGNLYAAGDGSKVAVFLAASPQIVGRVTLTVTGAATLTTVDAWGNTTSVAVSNGRAAIPTQELPVYVRLPAGVTANLYSYGDWPPLAAATVGRDLPKTTRDVAPIASNGVNASALTLADGAYHYAAPFIDSGTAPCTIGVQLGWPTRFDRVTIWCQPPWQPHTALVDFDVQTSTDGATWTTQATVTRPTPTSFLHGHDSTTGGCARVTYMDEAWIFDVKLSAAVTAKYVRLDVRSTTFGGQPDAAAAAMGLSGPQRPYVNRLAVYCDDTATPRYITKF